jgi:ribosomal 50S subunit-recycling heat shock protein
MNNKEGLLFQINVTLTEEDNIAVTANYIKPSDVVKAAKELEVPYEQGHVLASVIRHCLGQYEKMSDELKELLKRL